MQQRKDSPVFEPGDFLTYLADRLGKPRAEICVPEDAVFTYDSGIFRAAIARTKASRVDWYPYPERLYVGSLGTKRVGIVHAMVGSPAAAMNLEELIAYGARRVFEVGLAGGIDVTLSPGDVVVLRGAYSDEGTSTHYYKGGRWFESSRQPTNRLMKSLRAEEVKHSLGDGWTIDAPYRETKKKVVLYRGMGVKVVNMESSALFAVSKYRNIEVGSVQIVSDMVSEERWDPAFHKGSIATRRGTVLSAVLRSIRN
jgi:uridine phosphorylase